MTIVSHARSGREDPFLLDTVAADSLIGAVDDTGPVALTCNCAGSCQQGLCSGTCCTMPWTALEI
jgi:hypothetical protein